MEKQTETPSWCTWPHKRFIRDAQDLFTMGMRCDAWRSFLKSETIKKLKKIKGYVIWFNVYEHFDKLICEFDCTEKKLRNIIESLMIPGCEEKIEFVRKDIYDARAWACLPLSCFAKIGGCNKRSGDDLWQSDILKRNEIPIVQFGIKLPWVVSRDCFKLTHRIKYGERHAEMTFNHPQLDRRFHNERWVGKGVYPKKTTRKEMTEDIFISAEIECAKHLVTIID